MAASIVQYVFRPNPGTDLTALMAIIKEGATLWTAHGADVSLWNVQVGEIGNMMFAARFESASKLGAAFDGLNGDPAFGAWRAKSLAAGMVTWVRSNQAYQIPL